MKRRKQPKSRVFLISFVAVLVLLVGGAITLTYLSTVPVVHHLPGTLPVYNPFWAGFAPSDSLQFTFRNYTAVRMLNSSLYTNGTLFTSISPAFSLPVAEIGSLISVVFLQPNATVDIALVSPVIFSSVHSIRTSNGPTPLVQGDAKLYFTQIVGSSGFVSGWILSIPSVNAIGFSQGVTPARTVIEDVLAVRNGTLESVFARTDVTQMFYVDGGPNNHLAFTIENFPGLVSTGQMTLQFADYNQSMVRSSAIVKFSSSETALSQFDFDKQQYQFTYDYFTIYDQYVLAQRTQPVADLFGAIQNIG